MSSWSGFSILEMVSLFPPSERLSNHIQATVVFTSTAMARLVRDDFRKKARSAGPYQGVQVTFSHDPCERSMNLISQMHYTTGEGQSRSDNFTSAGPALGMGVTRKQSRRNNKTVDKDGWETVQSKKR
jgi:hypothetical protein